MPTTLPAPALQPELIRLAKTRPLWPVKAAMCYLEMDEDEIIERVESQEFQFAFDLGSLDTTARDVRIFRGSIEYFALHALHGHVALHAREAAADLPDVITAILPGFQWHIDGKILTKTIRARELADAFVCSSKHILDLINEGSLHSLTDPRRGRNGSPRVTEASAREFLTGRRIT